MSPGAPHGPEEARAAAEAVLAQDAYAAVRSFRLDGKELVSEVEGLLERLRDLLNTAAVLHVTSPYLYWGILGALGLLLAVLVWHILYSLRRMHDRPAREEPARTLGDGGVGELRAAIVAALDRGERLEAQRLRFRLFLLVYHQRHPGVLSQGMTNRECAARIHLSQELDAALWAVVDALDRKWYGREQATEEDLWALEAGCDRLLERAR